MDVTRRTLARVLAGIVSAPLSEAASQAPASEPNDDQSAHDLLKSNAQQLAKVALPMATEPAFRFKA
jgi:hypothetical protein